MCTLFSLGNMGRIKFVYVSETFQISFKKKIGSHASVTYEIEMKWSLSFKRELERLKETIRVLCFPFLLDSMWNLIEHETVLHCSNVLLLFF